MTTRTDAESKAKKTRPSAKVGPVQLSDRIRAFKRRAPKQQSTVVKVSGAVDAKVQVRPGTKRLVNSYVVIRPADLEKLIVGRIKAELPRLMQEAQQVAGPFDTARARGDAYKRAELAKPENLSLAEAAQRLQLSDGWVNKMRNRHELYALVDTARERGFRYPGWQFDASKKRLSEVLKALSAAEVKNWGIHAFMNSQSAELSGRTPREAILDGAVPLPDILRVVERRYAPDQGAQ